MYFIVVLISFEDCWKVIKSLSVSQCICCIKF